MTVMVETEVGESVTKTVEYAKEEEEKKKSTNRKQQSMNTQENVRKRVAVLNVGGLNTKLLFPEFDDLLKSKDILCLTETKLDNADTIDLNDFICFKKNRMHFKHKSGGIAALIRKNVVKNMTVIKNIDFKKHVDDNVKRYYRFVTHQVPKDCLIIETPSVDYFEPTKLLYLCVAYLPP